MEIDSNVTNEEVSSSGALDDDEMLIDSDNEVATNKEEYDSDEVATNKEEYYSDEEYSDEVFCEEEREFGESDSDGSNGDEFDEYEPDEIVDQPLSNEEMPHINGEFAPYFKNITEALMFCWIQKHNICKFLY